MIIKCIVFLEQGMCGELASFCCEDCALFFCAFHFMKQEGNCKACNKSLTQMTKKLETKMKRKLEKLRKEYIKKNPNTPINKPVPGSIKNLPPIGKKAKGRVR